MRDEEAAFMCVDPSVQRAGRRGSWGGGSTGDGAGPGRDAGTGAARAWARQGLGPRRVERSLVGDTGEKGEEVDARALRSERSGVRGCDFCPRSFSIREGGGRPLAGSGGSGKG